MERQSGFTLIELVMVIIILGILAATAMPKFVNFKEEAAQAALAGMAGGLSSANAVNYSARSLNVASGVVVANCTDVQDALAVSLPAEYSITALAISPNVTEVCLLTSTEVLVGSPIASFAGTGIL